MLVYFFGLHARAPDRSVFAVPIPTRKETQFCLPAREPGTLLLVQVAWRERTSVLFVDPLYWLHLEFVSHLDVEDICNF